MSMKAGGTDGDDAEIDVSIGISRWLRATSMIEFPDAYSLLYRAVSPASVGLKREPLVLPPPNSPSATAIARLIRAGQVPTAPSIEQTIRGIESRGRRTRLVSDWLRHLDVLGEGLAAQVDDRWTQHEYGPTWAELRESTSTTALASRVGLDIPRDQRSWSTLMRHVSRAGWLASNETPRSLCAGPTFHSCRRGKAERLSSHEIGERVAKVIGEFRFRRHKSPTWYQIAQRTYDRRGRRVFADAVDAEAQARWLLVERWIRIEDGEIRRGIAAKDAKRRKAEARERKREALSSEPRSNRPEASGGRQ